MGATRRRLPALAVLLAVVLLAWGVACGISLWVQVSETDYELYEGTALTVLVLHNVAAFAGAWAVLWGLFGLGWRPPLHLGAVVVMVAMATDVVALVIVDSELGLSVGDQLEAYLDAALGEYGAQPFWTAAPLVFGPLVLLLWLVVLVAGAGRKVAVGYPEQGYPQQGYPQQGYPQAAYQQQGYYPQPAYQQPPPQQGYHQQQPAYQQPAYQQPAYQEPAPQQPAYQQPAPQQPVQQPWPAPVVPQAPPPESRTLILPPDNPAVWFAYVAGQECGPFSLADLHSRLRSGELSRDTQVRREQGAPVTLGELLGV